MLHKSTIKSQVKKTFPGVEIKEIKMFSFGVFSVKVTKQMSRSLKFGILMGNTDHDKIENGVDLESKIDWI
jgi:hypothetical protein